MHAARLLRNLLVAIAAVVVAEAALRQVDALDPTERDDPYLGFPGTAPLYREEVNAAGQEVYRRSPNKDKYRQAEFAVEKPADEYRVFCIGGSSVRSDAFMQPDGSFPFMLEIQLNAALQGKRARVINAGGGGMGSVQNLEVLREVLDYEPDLLVVYPEGGEKNLIPPSAAGVMAFRDDESPARVWTRRLLARMRVYLAARDLYNELLPPPPPGAAEASAFSAVILSVVAQPFRKDTFSRFFEMKEKETPPLMEQPISDEVIAQAHERFQRNLRTMAELAADEEVPLIFMLPVRNLKQSIYLRFHITPEELLPGKEEQWRRKYEEAIYAKSEQRYARAIEDFLAVRACYRVDRDEILAWHLGTCYEALGRKEEALAEYSKPYLRHPMLGQIRGVAAAEGVPLVDPFPELLAIAEDGIPGYAEFTDAFHPMPKTNEVLAAGVMRAIREQGYAAPLRPESSPECQQAEKTLERLVEFTTEKDTPRGNLMLRAIEAGHYDIAIALAESVPRAKLLNSATDPLYLGWALTKKGDLERARALLLELRSHPAIQSGLRLRIPPLDTKEQMVRIAFSGDVFHWF